MIPSWAAVKECNLVKVVSRFKAFSVYLHTCSDPVQPPCSVQATPGALAVNFQWRIPSTREAPCWPEPSRGNAFAGLCLSYQYRTQAEDEQSQADGSPAHTELGVPLRDVARSCRSQATAPASAESQCAARCLEPDFSPFPPHPSCSITCYWEKLDVGSIQTKSVGRGLYQPAPA